MVGQTLKHFQIQARLGEGGMGQVYRSLDTRLQRQVAIKVLSPEVTADPERRKRLLLEARAAARLSHPAIAQVYDVDEADGVIFIAMEYVQGKTIRDLIRQRELDLLGSIDIAIQVAEGLARAHEAGIIHRDIKPANVILTQDGRAKILDFGLAKLTDVVAAAPSAPAGADLSTLTQTQLGAVMGTAAYMSPEQVKGVTVDPRSDIFALGVMLFEMATGELPFRGATPLETMHAVAFDDTPSVLSLRPGLPVELQRILSRCLRKRPEDRYATATDVVRDLKILRQDTEAGREIAWSIRARWDDLLGWLRHLRTSDYVWLGIGLVGLAVVVYFIASGIDLGRGLFFGLVALFLYRSVRNRHQRMLEKFVRAVSPIPEVLVITAREGNLTVAVDTPSGQLYGRIQNELNACNRKLFFGKPMTVALRHNLSPDETQSLLAGSGVHYVKDGLPQKLSAVPPRLPAAE